MAAALELNLLARRRAPSTGYATTSIQAYNEYLLGRQFRRQGYAQSTLIEAIALDPAYASAWAGLAEAVYFLADFADSPADVLALQARAASAAEKAVDLARARALSPTDAWSQRNYGVLLSYLGRLPEATQALLDAPLRSVGAQGRG